MTKSKSTIASATATTLALLFLGALSGGCSGKGKEADKECVDPPPEAVAGAKKTVTIERFGLGKAGSEDKEKKDWCRACVMAKMGYASCQRVFAETPDEERDSIRARARAKACADAKYPKDACPDQAVINIQCKGEAPPPGTPDPGTALQNLFEKMGGYDAKPEVPPKPGAKAGPETDKVDKPSVE
jgi:hypothetical protein